MLLKNSVHIFFKRGRAYLSKKALTSKKKGTLGKKDKRFGHFSHYFFLIKKQNGGALKSVVFTEKGGGRNSKINI